MAQIQKGDTFTNGQQVDATRLNQLVDSSVLLVGAISEQTTMTPNTVESTDQTIINDGGVLKKTTVGSILNSNLPVTTSSITGGSGADIIVTPSAGQKVDVVGEFRNTGNTTVTGNTLLDAGLTVNGVAAFNTTSAIKIPVGTTVQRPATPVAGQMRYNSTLDQAEVYSGTEWKAVGGSPFDASGGTVTTVDGYKIHTFTTSGTFTPALNLEGKVEVLVVGGGGGGGYYNPHGGGGGGGDVKYSVVTIPKNTAPIAITVGTGGAVGASGTFSVFGLGNITCSGGAGGSGYSGGGSGSGLAGTTGNFSSGGGGGGGARTASAYMFLGGGVGGEGFGSSISGTLKKYGGGGGGAGSTYGSSSNYPGLGLDGGGRGANSTTAASAPEVNSGAGGGGGQAYNNGGRAATAGADGVVIIRYRVS